MPKNANGHRHSKSDLPQKTCVTCARPFNWRRKWKDCWDAVQYCSNRCRHQPKQPEKNRYSEPNIMMLDHKDADQPTYAILLQHMMNMATQRGAAKTFCPSEVAKTFGSCWRELMPRVHQVAERLCAEGKLTFEKGGVSHGPNRPSGHYRLRIVAEDDD